jgi:hypothetical protein
MKLTTSRGPTPRSENRFAVCVTPAMNCAWLSVSGVSSGSQRCRNWIAGAAGSYAAPARNAS